MRQFCVEHVQPLLKNLENCFRQVLIEGKVPFLKILYISTFSDENLLPHTLKSRFSKSRHKKMVCTGTNSHQVYINFIFFFVFLMLHYARSHILNAIALIRTVTIYNRKTISETSTILIIVQTNQPEHPVQKHNGSDHVIEMFDNDANI